MLSKMCKGFKVENIYDAVHRAKRLMVRPAGPFIVSVAYPRESEEGFEETLMPLRNLPLMDYFVSTAEPYRGRH